MQLFADESVAAQIVRQLRDLGHDVLYPPETEESAADEIWLNKAQTENRVLITDDKDFGELVFRKKMSSAGIVLLRLHRLPLPDRLLWLKPRWEQILSRSPGNFAVVTDQKIRIRPIR